MFQKINLTLLDIDLDILKGPRSTPREVTEFIEYSIWNVNYLFEIFQGKIEFGIMPDMANVTEISGKNYPHRDEWTTAINCYIHASGDITTFFKFKEGCFVDQLLYIPEEKLDIVGTFIPQTGDCYLLNTNNPHTVTTNNPKIILRLIWKTTIFEDVLKNIRIL